MKITRVLLMVLPVASVVFASGCGGDELNKVPTCTDGAKNQDETDKDCGGLTCPACRMNSTCQANADCLVGICDGGACLGGDAPLNAAQLCALYYATYQNTRDQDGGLYQIGYPGAVCTQAPIFDARKFDTELLAYLCRPGTAGYKWGQSLVTAVNEGRVSIDWALAKTCLESSRELRSSKPGVEVVSSPEWMTLKLGICTSFYEGAKAAGAACKEDWDCQGDMGCYTTTPGVAGSRKCMAGAGQGDDCTEWLPCAPGMVCDSNGSCAASGTDGSDCYYPADCDSGVCGPDGTCITPTKGIGEECEEYEPESAFSYECNIPNCGSCRPTALGGRTTCQMYGKEGDFCRTWMDCAYDLGCLNNVCTTSPVGALCGPGVQGMCVTGAVCIPPATCELYSDATACEGDTFCYWDDYYSACSPDTGTCVGEDQLPETGACYGPGVCASRAFCNTANVCVLLGTEGATCDDDHPCNEGIGYICADGRCTFACEMNEDCPTGQYCYTGGDYPICEPINESACDPYETSCPADKYCDVPGMWCDSHMTLATCTTGGETECDWTPGTCTKDPEGPCPAKTTEPTCRADTTDMCTWAPIPDLCDDPDCTAANATACTGLGTHCTWIAAVGTTPAYCAPECWQYDGDATGCSGHGCYWDDYYGYCYAPCLLVSNQTSGNCAGLVANFSCRWQPPGCQTLYDCTPFNGQDDNCEAAANCTVGVASVCEVKPALNTDTGACTPKLAVGEDCLANMDSTADMCVSNYSVWLSDSAEFAVCAEPASNPGCISNETIKMFINLNFLFGGVMFLNRLRRRRV